MIHWTRQIKEVVGQHSDVEFSDQVGPLAEIRYWAARSRDLGGVRQQLEAPQVAAIVTALEQAQSSYLAPFRCGLALAAGLRMHAAGEHQQRSRHQRHCVMPSLRPGQVLMPCATLPILQGPARVHPAGVSGSG